MTVAVLPNSAWTLGILAAWVAAWPVGAARADFNVGNGGDLVVCRAPGEFVGTFVLDYVATYNQRNANADIVPVASWDESARRLVQMLDAKSPDLGRSFRLYLDDFENFDDLTRPRHWVDTPFGLVDLQDEDLIGRLPPNCGEMSPDGRLMVQQTVVRRAGRDVVEYYVDRGRFRALRDEAPLQFSFLAVHEWAWDLTSDVQALRRFVRYLHSSAAAAATPEEFQLTLRRLEIPRSDSVLMGRPVYRLDSAALFFELKLGLVEFPRSPYRPLRAEAIHFSERATRLRNRYDGGAPLSELKSEFADLSTLFYAMRPRFYAIHGQVLNDEVEDVWVELVLAMRACDAVFGD